MIEMQTQEQTLESKLNESVRLLSFVMNEPVSLFYIDPLKFDGTLSDVIDFQSVLCFGEEYKINFWHVLKREDSYGPTHWSIENAGFEVKDRNKNVLSRMAYSSSESYDQSEILEDPRVLDIGRIKFLLKELDRIDVECPDFMDYETYTIESIKDHKQDSYFQSAYLAIMCSLKEKGVRLPPILSKKENIREAMFNGEIESLDFLISQQLKEIESEYSKGMFEHARVEADRIRTFGLGRRMYHDTSVPLIEKMVHWDVKTVPGNGNQRKYNVLVVEDFGGMNDRLDDLFYESMDCRNGTIGKLSEKVVQELNNIGRYGGSNVFATFRIADCLEICGTGQIDAILMDGGHFLLGEIEEYSLTSEIGVGLSQNNEKTDIPGLNGYGEKSNWKKRIFRTIEANGHSPPPCLIIPKNILSMAVGQFVHDMLRSRE